MLSIYYCYTLQYAVMCLCRTILPLLLERTACFLVHIFRAVYRPECPESSADNLMSAVGRDCKSYSCRRKILPHILTKTVCIQKCRHFTCSRSLFPQLMCATCRKIRHSQTKFILIGYHIGKRP